MRLTVVFALILASWRAEAAPLCDNADRGTYLSNVCWLFERFTEQALFPLKPHIVIAADRDACTATYQIDPRPMENVIHFTRSNGERLVEDEWPDLWSDDGVTCWSLWGEDIHTRHYEDVDYSPRDEVRICGALIDHDRVINALENLFGRYCPVEQPEF